MTASDVTWLITTLAASLAGLMIGYWLGTLTREVHELRQAMIGDDDPTQPGAAPFQGDRRQGRDRRAPAPTARVNMLVGISMVALSVMSVAASAIAVSREQALVERQQRQVACQARYNEALSEAVQQRILSAAQDRRAIRDLVQVVGQARALPEAEGDKIISAAFARFLEETAEADRRRANNPVPAQPC